jgi:hypothetical protein
MVQLLLLLLLVASLLQRTVQDILFSEGFLDHSNLPGGLNDSSNRYIYIERRRDVET